MSDTPLIILETQEIQQEVKKVALKTASDLAIKGLNSEREKELFYSTSGLQLIFREILKDGLIRDNVDAIFIENSTLVSTLEDDFLDAFTIVWQSGKEKNLSFKNNVENFFSKIIDVLRKHNATIFNHPDFFVQPKKVETLISILHNELISKFHEKDRLGYNKREIDRNDRVRNAFRKAEELYYTDKYQYEIPKSDKVRTMLFQHIDESLNDRIIYFNSSRLSGISYDDIKSQKTLDSHFNQSEDPYGLHLLNHFLYAHFFLEPNQQNYTHPDYQDRKSIFVSLPLIASKSRHESKYIENFIQGNLSESEELKYEGIGAIFIFLLLKELPGLEDPNNIHVSIAQDREKTFNNTIKQITDRLEQLCNKLPSILKDFVHGYAFDISQRRKEEVEHHAIQALISQVMARNMSHNIGSHVSYKATNIAIKNRIVELYPDEFSARGETKAAKIKELNKNDYVIDWIDFMSEKLDKHEINRNEYLANHNLSPQSFHFYQDVILPFVENTLILDNIASAEGAKYVESKDNKLKIKVFIKKGSKPYTEIKSKYPNLTNVFSCDKPEKEIVYPDYFPYLLKNKNEKEPFSNGMNSKRIVGTDVEVLLHSEQGIYSILENFIRNSAKHNKSAIAKKGLEVSLYLEEKDKDFELIIFDNVSKLPSEKLFNTAPRGLYQIIKSDLFEETKLSSRQNLGLADMKINSFLFRNKSADIKNKTLGNNFDLVKINTETSPISEKITEPLPVIESGYSFGYKMELLKPRKVLWIGEDIAIIGGNITSLKKDGILRFDSLDTYLINTKKDSEIALFDFVVFYKSFNFNSYMENQIMLPPRVLAVSADELQKIKKPNIVYLDDGNFNNITDADELVEKCWHNWLNRLRETKAYIYYENNKEACEQLDSIRLERFQTIKCANNLDQPTIIDDNSISVVYDHHGWAMDSDVTNLKTLYEDSDSVTNFYTRHSKIVFDKGSEDFGLLNYLPADESKKKLLSYQLIDAATTNIFILDERIAITANNPKANQNDKAVGMLFGKYDKFNFSRFCYGKVFAINNISIDLGEGKPIHSENQNYYLCMQIENDNIKFKIQDDAKEVLEEINSINKDIFLIHRTYLNEVTLGMSVKAFLELAGKIFGSVVVTSGGGYPHNLEENVRFIPFSIVEQCVNSRLSKLKLVSNLQKLKFVK